MHFRITQTYLASVSSLLLSCCVTLGNPLASLSLSPLLSLMEVNQLNLTEQSEDIVR